MAPKSFLRENYGRTAYYRFELAAAFIRQPLHRQALGAKSQIDDQTA